MADVYTTTAIITAIGIRVEQTTRYAKTLDTIATGDRPTSLVNADVFLASNGLRRVQEWDLGDFGTIRARVQLVDNKFNGVRAVRLWGIVGTQTHENWKTATASEIREGDIISDLGLSAAYLVAAVRSDIGTVKVCMVGECQTWQERHTTSFPREKLIKVAHKTG